LGKVVAFIGATLGGAAGWWLGSGLGTMTAFFLSILGTAAGLYAARRWVSEYLP
jgi:membrane protein YqaA with SNARE-associated domain